MFELCEKWLRANPRKDFTPSKNSKVCSLHFRDEDFVEISNDSNNRRRRKNPSVVLLNRYLKKDAVPSIFPNAPSYLSPSIPSSRPSAAIASSSGRFEQETPSLGRVRGTLLHRGCSEFFLTC